MNMLSLYQAAPVSINLFDKLGVGTFFKITSVGSVVSGILGAALIFAGLAFMIYFVWGAFNWLTAGGDKNQVEAARQRISNAAIGLVLVAAAWAIYLLVFYVLGLTDIVNLANGGPPGPGPVGNQLCGGCIGGGCGTTGQVYINNLGTCSLCSPTGWVNDPGPCSVNACGSCPP